MSLPTWLSCVEPGCEAPHEPHSLRCAPHRMSHAAARGSAAQKSARARKRAAKVIGRPRGGEVPTPGLFRCACGALLWRRDIPSHRCELPAERLLRICSERRGEQ